MKANIQGDTIVDLLLSVYAVHAHSNTADQDGKPCYKCGGEIPLIYPTRFSKITGRCFVKVDRSNRVDVNLETKTNGIQVVSYHIDCWRSLI